MAVQPQGGPRSTAEAFAHLRLALFDLRAAVLIAVASTLDRVAQGLTRLADLCEDLAWGGK